MTDGSPKRVTFVVGWFLPYFNLNRSEETGGVKTLTNGIESAALGGPTTKVIEVC